MKIKEQVAYGSNILVRLLPLSKKGALEEDPVSIPVEVVSVSGETSDVKAGDYITVNNLNYLKIDFNGKKVLLVQQHNILTTQK